MKKTIKTLVSISLGILFLISFAACQTQKKEVGRSAIDKRYTPSYQGVETEYEYKFDFYNADFVLVPVVKTVFYAEKYEVLYKISYDNGETSTKWETTDKSTYEKIVEGGCNNGQTN